jgi:shikimate kinase
VSESMKRILITGMSATGKSSVITELATRGYHAVDADSDEYSGWVEVIDDSNTPGSPVEAGRDRVWREDRIRSLLSCDDAGVLFLSGTAANMGKFLVRFDHVVLLSAPAELIVERLAKRTTNRYGKRPAEVARVLDLIASVEPLLRRIASHEIDTSLPLDDVVAKVIQIAGQIAER